MLQGFLVLYPTQLRLSVFSHLFFSFNALATGLADPPEVIEYLSVLVSFNSVCSPIIDEI